jgi:hypothetical protein
VRSRTEIGSYHEKGDKAQAKRNTTRKETKHKPKGTVHNRPLVFPRNTDKDDIDPIMLSVKWRDKEEN